MEERASTGAEWDFRVEVERPRTGTVVLAVVGDADLHAAPELRERLAAAIDDGTPDIVLDLSQATFVDSMALGVLLGGMKRQRSAGGRLQLVVSRPDIRRIFEITLLDRVLPLYATRDEALVPAEPDSRGAG
jgi:anti-sigma B factor antagonist